MIVVMKMQATQGEIAAVLERVEEAGCKVHPIVGVDRTVIGAIGDGRAIDMQQIGRMKGVENVLPITKPYKAASREFHPEDTVFTVGDATFGGDDYTDIYVTTAGGDNKPEEGDGAGALFRINLGIRGVEEFHSRVGL